MRPLEEALGIVGALKERYPLVDFRIWGSFCVVTEFSRQSCYHFCWYNTSCIGTEKAEYPGYYAMCIRGQVFFVNPYKDLIMVRLSLRDDTDAHIPYLFGQMSNLWPE